VCLAAREGVQRAAYYRQSCVIVFLLQKQGAQQLQPWLLRIFRHLNSFTGRLKSAVNLFLLIVSDGQKVIGRGSWVVSGLQPFFQRTRTFCPVLFLHIQLRQLIAALRYLHLIEATRGDSCLHVFTGSTIIFGLHSQREVDLLDTAFFVRAQTVFVKTIQRGTSTSEVIVVQLLDSFSKDTTSTF